MIRPGRRAAIMRELEPECETPEPAQCRVRVWFGEHAIANYQAAAPDAADYAAAMANRFKSLRVTNEPLSTTGDDSVSLARLPAPVLWDVTPR
jgi:hypothetical protein